MSISRKHFLKQAGAVALGFSGLQFFDSCSAGGHTGPAAEKFGPLLKDPNGIFDLPQGFSYKIISRFKDQIDDGLFVPHRPDGMATFPGPNGMTILIRNHEVNPAKGGDESAFGSDFALTKKLDKSRFYDPGQNNNPGQGGTTTIIYDTKKQRVVKQFLSLAGTLRNCAGGPTSWNSWLSCKEKVMKQNIRSIITGTGSYIPERRIPNADFESHTFLTADGKPFEKDTKEIIQKFEEITGIKERRYATDDLLPSDMGVLAAEKALESAGLDRESLDYIIVAHNFGDVRPDNRRVDMLPSLAARIKYNLEINNPPGIVYNLPFGYPGWLQGIIQGHYYLTGGEASRVMVIGTETLSRVCDPHDRDSMIYADGAGATIIEAKEDDRPTGILAHSARSDTREQAYYLNMGKSYHPDSNDTLYLKMEGRKLYHYALNCVPQVIKSCLKKADISLDLVDKVFIHQANEKMDKAILKRLFSLCEMDPPPNELMPMTISWLGNTSVATIPTLPDLVMRNKLEGHEIKTGDKLLFTSVGGGMNINSVVYSHE